MPKTRKELFDDIYVNKLNTDYGSLYKGVNRQEKEKDNSVLEDLRLENIVEQSRSTENFKLTKEQAELLTNKIASLREEVPVVATELKEVRESIDSYIRSRKDAFSLNINENSGLKSAALEVFQEEKTVITYDDYSTLLEMKKLLDVDETFDLLSEEL